MGTTGTLTLLKELEHQLNSAIGNSLIKIDDTHYILAYGTEPSAVNYLKTFSIDSLGNITSISLKSIASYGRFSSIVLIDSTHVLVSYSGFGDFGVIKVFSFDSSFENITEVKSLEHDSVNCTQNSLCKIDSTHFGLTYCQSANGIVKTFSIDASFNITEEDSISFTSIAFSDPGICYLGDSVLAMVYVGIDSDGFVRTFSFDSNYDITAEDTLEHETSFAMKNAITTIDSTHFAICYYRYSGGATTVVKTFSINASDEIVQEDSLVLQSYKSNIKSIILVQDGILCIATDGIDSDGYIYIVEYDSSFELTNITNIESDDTYSRNASIINGASGMLVVAYTGSDGDGFMKTFSISITISALVITTITALLSNDKSALATIDSLSIVSKATVSSTTKSTSIAIEALLIVSKVTVSFFLNTSLIFIKVLAIVSSVVSTVSTKLVKCSVSVLSAVSSVVIGTSINIISIATETLLIVSKATVSSTTKSISIATETLLIVSKVTVSFFLNTSLIFIKVLAIVSSLLSTISSNNAMIQIISKLKIFASVISAPLKGSIFGKKIKGKIEDNKIKGKIL